MSCMCGDIQCPSCGLAQGNSRCPICGAWMDDCCEHFESYCEICGNVLATGDEDGGERCGAHGHDVTVRLKAEYVAEAEERERQIRADEEALAKDIEESTRLAEEYWRTYRD